tara:strand:- start:127 stop:495 length:369 start_codon:yes stop_codon:yes gene_type:complete
MSISTCIILIVIGVLAGLLSGVVGVGGGLIMIPLLIILLDLSQHEAQGTSLAVMLPPIGILAAINYHKAGFVRWEYSMIIAITFIIGGYFGSRYAVVLKPEILKRVFGMVMLIGALKMIFSK